MKKEIENAKKEKAKVRYFLLKLIEMNWVYCTHSPCCACVYAAGGGTEEEISEWSEGCSERGTVIARTVIAYSFVCNLILHLLS